MAFAVRPVSVEMPLPVPRAPCLAAPFFLLCFALCSDSQLLCSCKFSCELPLDPQEATFFSLPNCYFPAVPTRVLERLHFAAGLCGAAFDPQPVLLSGWLQGKSRWAHLPLLPGGLVAGKLD